METIITKKVAPDILSALFDEADKVNIRYFDKVENFTSFTKPVKYKIKIRHNEDEDPRKILDNAIKDFKAKQVIRESYFSTNALISFSEVIIPKNHLFAQTLHKEGVTVRFYTSTPQKLQDKTINFVHYQVL